MATETRRIPLGPAEKYSSSDDLLSWLGKYFVEFGGIYRASIYGADVYVISAPEYVEHVLLKNWQNYPKGFAIKRIALLLGNGLMVSKGDLWKRQRRMIQPAFNRAALGELTGMITAANQRLLDKWANAARAQEAINVTRDISLTILEIVLLSIFGEDYEEVAPHFRLVSEEAARDLKFAHVFNMLGSRIVEIAAKRRHENRIAKDFLGMMMEARDRDSGEGMSDAQLTKEVMTLIVAGHETTASTLNWMWYLLAQNPHAQLKLSAELSKRPPKEIRSPKDLEHFAYPRMVIEEALRLYPPGWLMTRRAVKDDHIGEYFVPAGTEIYISPYYIQRHPHLWTEPDVFNPDRFDPATPNDTDPLALLPFSIGPRNCIGEHLARMEMEIHLVMIASRLRLHRLDSNEPAMAAGVNLLSAHDFMMQAELIEAQ
jgi:cytochrome P450